MKYHNIVYSLNRLQITVSIIEQRHQKLYDNLVVKNDYEMVLNTTQIKELQTSGVLSLLTKKNQY